MIKILRTIAYSSTLLLSLTACGGGGSNSSTNTPAATKATVKIAIAGTLPATTNISGVGVKLTLPAGITVTTDNNGSVTTGSVTPSGIFATGTQTTPLYTAASGANAATLMLGLASGSPTGENQVGEIVTINFDLASGTTPSISSFLLSDLTVVNATTYDTIPGLNGSVISVTLH